AYAAGARDERSERGWASAGSETAMGRKPGRNSGHSGSYLSGILTAFSVICGCLSSGSTLGQEASLPVQVQKPTPPSALPGPSCSAPRRWGPSLDWSPRQPELPVDSDCFVSAEIALVFPQLSSVLSAPVTLGGTEPARPVRLENTHLNTTVSPLFQLGAFRFGPCYGELAISYQFVATDGNGSSVGDGGGAAHARSRLNLQAF